MSNRVTKASQQGDRATLGSGNDRALSSVLVRHIFLAAVFTTGVHTPLTLVFQIFQVPFKYFLIISPLLVLCCLMVTGELLRREWGKIERRDTRVTGVLLLLGLVCLGIVFVTYTPTEDDYYYASNAVHYLDNPDQPMNFEWHYFRGAGEAKIISYNQGTAMAFEYLRAVPANFLHLDYLDVYYTLSIAILGLLIPLGHFLLISRFSRNSSEALAGTVLAMALLLMLTQRSLLHGCLTFGHLQMGKVGVLAIGVPLFAAWSVEFFEHQTLSRWVALFFLIMAAVGLSASAALLLPLLGICLLCAFLVSRRTDLTHASGHRHRLSGAVSYLASSGYAVCYLIFLLYNLRIRQRAADPFAIAYGNPGAPFKFQEFLQPFFLALLVISLLMVIGLSRGWKRRFLVTWTLAVALLLVDPAVTSLLIDRVIPQNIYWRIFYLLPFPLIGAVAGMELRHRAGTKGMKTYFSLAVCMVFAATVTHYCWGLQQRKSLQWSRYKLDYSHLATAREVTRVAPDGVMLAPEELFFIIPMIESGHPQVNVRFHDGKFVLPGDDWAIRTGAAHFAGNKSPFEEHFMRLIEQNFIDVVVLHHGIFKKSSFDIEEFLLAHGYRNRAPARNYLVLWR